MRLWVHLMSLDVVDLVLPTRTVVLRYSADSAAGAFTGDATLAIGPEREMAVQLFTILGQETRRRCGQRGAERVPDNFTAVEIVLQLFLRTFRVAVETDELEPMEMALAKSAGIDFLAQSISLWEKELPERVEILLRRAASNLQFGYPAECDRDVIKVEMLDPANVRAAALRAKLDSLVENPSPATTKRPAPAGRKVSTTTKRRPSTGPRRKA